MAVKYIPINSIVAITGFSKGLQESMARDFVSSGYSNTAPLMGKTEADTSKNIQNKVDGFSSGKNTYLQANQLAKIIHQYSSSVPRKRYAKRTTTASMPSGDLLKDCSGWSITKKTLDDGRVVYNADIKADTPKNKGDWAAIKGDVYVETGFKWNFKFQKFERWGQIENESEVIEKLCEVLAKYYEGGNKPTPSKEPTPTPMPETPTPTPESEDESTNVYIDGEFIQKVNSEHDAFVLLVNNFGAEKLKKMRDNHQVFNNRVGKRIEVFRYTFIYGAKWGVPKDFGNDLQLEFSEKGFRVFASKKYLIVWKDGMALDGIIISDNGGEFNLDSRYNESIGSVNYILDESPINPTTLAFTILDIYNSYLSDKKEEKTEAPKKSKEDIEKAIKGLQFLADKGNEKAKKAIIGLKILLNK
jgi:hypothetical protein